jgi:hypothetical protein
VKEKKKHGRILLISIYIKSNHGKLNHKWANPSLGGTTKNHLKEGMVNETKPTKSFF